MRSLGDHALQVSESELRLVSSSGVTARRAVAPAKVPKSSTGAKSIAFDNAVCSIAARPTPPRLALHLGAGELDLDSFGARRSIRNSSIELVDVDSGEVQTRLTQPVDSLVAWSPDGSRLFFNDGETLVAMDATGRMRSYDDVVDVDWMRFAADGHRALVRSRRRRELTLLDVSGGVIARVPTCYARDVVTDADLARCCVIESDGGVSSVQLHDGLGDGVITLSSERVTMLRLWADRDLRTIAGIDGNGVLRTWSAFDRRAPVKRVRLVFGAPDWRPEDIQVDVAADRVLYIARGTAWLRQLGGKRLGIATATQAVLTQGKAVILADSVVQLLDERGAHPIPGPTRVTHIAAHARGVLAVDDNDRAHVVEL